MTLIDTDVLIDVSRNRKPAVDYLDNLESRDAVSISAFTALELIVGAFNKRDQRNIEMFIARFEIIEMTPAISKKTFNLVRTYRLSHNLLIPDAVIAATALITNSKLSSKNQKDFRFIPNLVLLPSPY